MNKQLDQNKFNFFDKNTPPVNRKYVDFIKLKIIILK
jgi:hypothetical protein